MGLFGRWSEREKGPERIKGAVIRYNGENFVGENHALARDALLARYPEMEHTPQKEEARGWLTSKGRIVGDDEAYAIKLVSGQIPRDEPPSRYNE